MNISRKYNTMIKGTTDNELSKARKSLAHHKRGMDLLINRQAGEYALKCEQIAKAEARVRLLEATPVMIGVRP